MLRVLVVEERQAVRHGLLRLLAAAGEITVVAEAGGTDEAAEIARRADCDVVVVGLQEISHDALFGLGHFRTAVPGMPVLLVGPAAGAELVREAVTRGASGYLDISRAREDLVKAVRAVCCGGVFVSAADRQPRRRRPPASH
jgi:DNA-binding NarL/FixJ family response regulator